MSDTVENKVAPAATVEEVEDASEAKGKGKEVEAEATAADASADADKEENPYAGLSEEELNAKVVTLVAEGKKAVALKQWEEAVAKYGESLEVKRQIVGEYDGAMAPLLYSYGRALYELVLTQQGVMGKEEVAKNTTVAPKDEAGPSNANASNFVFGGDGDDDDDDAEGEEGQGGEGEGEAQGEANPDEPEDDFNAAWDVLDVARTIYGRELDKPDISDEQRKTVRLALADCYLTLGDVSLETENFPQAVQDYTSALEIQKATLPASSRALASSHYQLGTVLEFTPAGRPAALKHVQAALDGFKLRAKEITTAQAGEPVPDSPDVAAMSAKEREAEARDVAALIGDIEVKIEELNSAPPAFDFIANSINHLLGGAPAPGASGSAAPVADSGPVNDLTSMVRKKKKPAAPAAAPVAAAPAPAAADAAASGAGDKRPAEVDAAGLAKKPKAE